jgi:6-phosphofructo-2-kinase/fructose-2,6-biphosphatase 2
MSKQKLQSAEIIRPASPHRRNASDSAAETTLQETTLNATFPRRTPSPAPALTDGLEQQTHTWESLGGGSSKRRLSVSSKSFSSVLSPSRHSVRPLGAVRNSSRSRSRSPTSIRGVTGHEERSRFFAAVAHVEMESDFEPMGRQFHYPVPAPSLRSLRLTEDDDVPRLSIHRFNTLPVLAPFKEEGGSFLENFYGNFVGEDGLVDQSQTPKSETIDSEKSWLSSVTVPAVVDTLPALTSPKSLPHLSSYETLEHVQKSDHASSNTANTTVPTAKLAKHQPLNLPAEDTKIAVVMVGLPATGKSFISRKLTRYMAWQGWSSRVFNVGSYRRTLFGSHLQADFFNFDNQEAFRARQEAARLCMEDMINAFQCGLCLGIFDATNSTKERRAWVAARLREAGISVMFVESICHSEEVILKNVTEVKLSGPDYQGVDEVAATNDFLNRIKHYEKSYETMDVSEGLSFVKIIDLGEQVQLNRVRGFLPTKIASFVSNLNVTPRTIYFTRHGESEANLEGKIGGNTHLSQHGCQYAKKLPEVLAQILPLEEKVVVWTSTLIRTIETARFLPYTKIAWKCLSELDCGDCDGLTYKEIEERFPQEYSDRDADKFYFRYRNGESYSDLCRRLEPVLMELERHESESLLVVCHQAVLRCLYAYLTGTPPEELPYVNVPLHTIIALSPRAHCVHEERWTIDVYVYKFDMEVC